MGDGAEKFEPLKDERGWVVEPADEYVRRMHAGALPNWPAEVLVEWLRRHAGCLFKYSFLRFERFRFSEEVWPLDRIPGSEAFDRGWHSEGFEDVEARASDPNDWLAAYMLENGTWNTPIVLLSNLDGTIRFPDGRPLASPFHLLEGHRRLSFLIGLRRLGRANAQHRMWVVALTKKKRCG